MKTLDGPAKGREIPDHVEANYFLVPQHDPESMEQARASGTAKVAAYKYKRTTRGWIYEGPAFIELNPSPQQRKTKVTDGPE